MARGGGSSCEGRWRIRGGLGLLWCHRDARAGRSSRSQSCVGARDATYCRASRRGVSNRPRVLPALFGLGRVGLNRSASVVGRAVSLPSLRRADGGHAAIRSCAQEADEGRQGAVRCVVYCCELHRAPALIRDIGAAGVELPGAGVLRLVGSTKPVPPAGKATSSPDPLYLVRLSLPAPVQSLAPTRTPPPPAF